MTAAAILTPQQLEAAARIQAAIVAIERIRKGINKTARANSIKIKPINLFELGMCAKEVEDALFWHSVELERQGQMEALAEAMGAAA